MFKCVISFVIAMFISISFAQSNKEIKYNPIKKYLKLTHAYVPFDTLDNSVIYDEYKYRRIIDSKKTIMQKPNYSNFNDINTTYYIIDTTEITFDYQMFKCNDLNKRVYPISGILKCVNK